MSCISINLPPPLLLLQSRISGYANTMLALTSESCNIFNALGLGDLEQGIQDLFATISDITSKINSFIDNITAILNSVLDTAVDFINDIMSRILNGLDSIANFISDIISSITAQLDSAIALLAERANILEIAACAGILGQLGILPPGVTAQIDNLADLVRSGTPVSSLADRIIENSLNDLRGTITGTVDRLLTGVSENFNNSQDLININTAALRNFSCAV